MIYLKTQYIVRTFADLLLDRFGFSNFACNTEMYDTFTYLKTLKPGKWEVRCTVILPLTK